MPENNELKDAVNNDSSPVVRENAVPEDVDASLERQREELRAQIAAANEDAKRSAQKETTDRSTVVAFGLLFILPALIIILSMLFLLPMVARTLQEEPSGATTLRSNSGDISTK